MNLKEINELVNLRSYISMALNNGSIEISTIRYLNNILLLLDKKIINLLMTDEFKSLIDYNSVTDVVNEARRVGNIKSGIKT